jgi:hypothetical protein
MCRLALGGLGYWFIGTAYRLNVRRSLDACSVGDYEIYIWPVGRRVGGQRIAQPVFPTTSLSGEAETSPLYPTISTLPEHVSVVILRPGSGQAGMELLRQCNLTQSGYQIARRGNDHQNQGGRVLGLNGMCQRRLHRYVNRC